MKAGKKAIVTAAKKSDQAVTAAGKSAGHAVAAPLGRPCGAQGRP